MKQLEKKWVWGNRLNKWYLVGSEHYDYSWYGISQEEMLKIGFTEATKKYVGDPKLSIRDFLGGK